MNNLKDYELNTTIPEFQFIIDALQYGVSSEEIQITKIGFDDFLKILEHSLKYEYGSIYLENHYAEAEYSRGYDDGYRDGYYEGELDWKD